ncbi:hypothetical protein M6B38_113190 [Iris pallida]|uniref:Uncharacterized protein n=1 Tax=Iris pallida TaxID=29817 RepID=A0AAX6IKJ9_IRIPA|nr:hypothetical protein M6B38_113190 [Iris pallida]
MTNGVGSGVEFSDFDNDIEIGFRVPSFELLDTFLVGTQNMDLEDCELN